MTAPTWWRRLADRRRARRESPFTVEEMADFAAEVHKAREARA